MTEWVLGLCGAAIVATLALAGHLCSAPAREDPREALCRALNRAGFRRPRGSGPFAEDGRVRLELRGATVEVALGTWSSEYECGPRAEFDVFPSPAGLVFGVERRTHAGLAAANRRDWYPVAVDGDDFDRAYGTRCSHAYGGALLDRPTRNAIEYLMSKCGASVSGDEIRFRVDYGHISDLAFHQAVAALVALLSSMATSHDDVPAALAQRAHAEAREEAGAISLRMLITEFPQHPETRRACDRALEGDAAATGLVAASLDRGPRALAALTLWSAVPQPVVAHRVEVIRELARNHSGADLTEVLARGLRDPYAEVACVAAEVAGARKEVSLVAPISRLVLHSDRALARSAVAALRSIAAPACEKALVEALDSPHREVRIDAAAALGPLGTLSAVIPLSRLAERLGSRGAVRQAARQAVSEIQARAGEAARGELALADAREFEGALATPASLGALSALSACGLRGERRPLALRQGAGSAYAQGADARDAGGGLDVRIEPGGRS